MTNFAAVPMLAAAAAAPFTTHWPIDVLRILIIALALWMTVLVAKMLWIRHVRPGTRPPSEGVHPAVMISYVGFLLISVFQREQRLGLPADVWLWATLLVLPIGAYGLLQRIGVQLPLGRAWRCRDRRDDEA